MKNWEFNVGHFPKGTVVQYKVGDQPAGSGTVTKVVYNGVNSNLLYFAEPDVLINIVWVTRIVKSGEGPNVVERY